MNFLGMFLHFVLAFLFTVLMFYQLGTFPPLWSGIVAVCLIVTMALIVRLLPFFKGLSLKSRGFQWGVNAFMNILFGLIIGFSWAFWHSFFMPSIPETLLNQPVWVSGKIIASSSQSGFAGQSKLIYKIQVESIEAESSTAVQNVTELVDKKQVQTKTTPLSQTYQAWSKPNIVINWYLPEAQRLAFGTMPALGETWRVRVKLKANHYSMSSGAFNYETWLFQQHITAKGYVKNYTQRELKSLSAPSSIVERKEPAATFTLYSLQSWVTQRLQPVFSKSEYSRFYQALTLGDKSTVTPEDWTLLQNTGTIHLLAISGLHMGIIATLGYLFFKALWWLGVYRIERVNLPGFAAWGALLFATLYLLLSGFSVPTQRAWLMVLAVLGFVLIKRSFQPWSALGFAAFLVVAWDSRSVLSMGFWLSFIAVALIFAAMPYLKNRSKWVQLLGLQGLITLGLSPFLIWAFNSLPLYSFIANLVAVPFITFIGLPLLFFASVIGLVSEGLGQLLIGWLDLMWVFFWGYLEWVDALPYSTIGFSSRSFWWLVWVMVFGFALLIFKAQRPRKIALIGVTLAVLSLVLPNDNRPESQQAWLTVLDVGQGQAVVVETKNSLLVYDTGTKMGPSMDGAKLAVLPYLKSQGWRQVDTLVISHSDSDHSGGTATLLDSLPVKKAISGQPEVMNQRLQTGQTTGNKSDENEKESEGYSNKRPLFSLCQAGQSWTVDGVLFEILSPMSADIGLALTSNNDLSCVLKITANGQSALIMGDLSKRGEALLIKESEGKSAPSVVAAKTNQSIKAVDVSLKSELLIAGHHGSNTSTGQAWLNAVSPRHIVFTAGYLNRYQFPNKPVLERIGQYAQERAQRGREDGAIGSAEPEEAMDSHELAPIKWWNTACSGALQFRLTKTGINLVEESRKTQRRWYHHACLNSQQGVLFQ